MPSPKKTIKFNPLDDISRQNIKGVSPPEEIPKPMLANKGNKVADNSVDSTMKQIVSYQLEGSLHNGTAELVFNGSHYGFELPDHGFIGINGKELKNQLKSPFLMSQGLGGLITGGPIGFLFSILVSEPKPKKYFFSMKSNQDGIIFISLERSLVESLIQIT